MLLSNLSNIWIDFHHFQIALQTDNKAPYHPLASDMTQAIVQMKDIPIVGGGGRIVYPSISIKYDINDGAVGLLLCFNVKPTSA